MTDDPNRLAESGFHMGVRVAQHVWGIETSFRDPKTDQVLFTLEAIAQGDLTLIGTPEEIADDSNPPLSVREKLPAILHDNRRNERRMARLILHSMFGDKFPSE